ncbi:unnamed protein product [Allacma fusca]|uniref:Vitelline membrane outer layer protein 1 n=1 Tax=Allacma fusca TaxID=39272 RepID=A0A8J2KBX7_9HEXA|nr:unnamed protein product [Allacma fusca]
MSGKLVFILAFCSARAIAEIEIIESPPLTNWGEWYNYEGCPYASYVYGFQLRVHEFLDFSVTDDTALNSLYLLCSTPDARRAGYEIFVPDAHTPPLTMISSKVGLYGDLRREWQCSSPRFAIGFELRVLEPQGVSWDDVAASNLILHCGYGESLLEFATLDDTALNNVRMGCCDPV